MILAKPKILQDNQRSSPVSFQIPSTVGPFLIKKSLDVSLLSTPKKRTLQKDWIQLYIFIPPKKQISEIMCHTFGQSPLHPFFFFPWKSKTIKKIVP